MGMPADKARRNADRIQRSWLRPALRVAIGLLVALVAILVLLMIFEESFVFFPAKYPAGDWNPPDLVFEDAWFKAADGTKLHGWFVPCQSPRAVALFAHGNAGNISHRDELLRGLHRLRIAVLAFDYRGYGRSEGSPTEIGVVADGRAARKWLADRTGISESEIVLMGESLGGGVVAQLAAELPARGLVLENTFTSIPDVAAVHYPGLPVKMLLRTRLDSAAVIRDYHGPLLQFHGTHDTIVPLALGKKLFEAANEPKQFVAIDNGDHNDPRSAEFYAAIDRFIDGLPSQTTR